MAPKLKQTMVADEEHFKSLVNSAEDSRLFVVDVYSAAWGPCKIMVPAVTSLLPHIEDFEERCELLCVDASLVPELAKYNGTSCPKFLFYKERALVKEITGADAPSIAKAITSLLPDAPHTACLVQWTFLYKEWKAFLSQFTYEKPRGTPKRLR